MLRPSVGVPLVLFLLASAAPLHAQTPSGEISGTVVDSRPLVESITDESTPRW